MLMPRSSRNDQNISTRTANPSPNPCATYEDAFRKRFASLDEFLSCWNAAGAKQAIVEELAAEGASLDAIADELAGPEPLGSVSTRVRPLKSTGVHHRQVRARDLCRNTERSRFANQNGENALSLCDVSICRKKL